MSVVEFSRIPRRTGGGRNSIEFAWGWGDARPSKAVGTFSRFVSFARLSRRQVAKSGETRCRMPQRGRKINGMERFNRLCEESPDRRPGVKSVAVRSLGRERA